MPQNKQQSIGGQNKQQSSGGQWHIIVTGGSVEVCLNQSTLESLTYLAEGGPGWR